MNTPQIVTVAKSTLGLVKKEVSFFRRLAFDIHLHMQLVEELLT